MSRGDPSLNLGILDTYVGLVVCPSRIPRRLFTRSVSFGSPPSRRIFVLGLMAGIAPSDYENFTRLLSIHLVVQYGHAARHVDQVCMLQSRPAQLRTREKQQRHTQTLSRVLESDPEIRVAWRGVFTASDRLAGNFLKRRGKR